MRYEYLIVGAGFTGCVLAERIASQLDKKVLIVEKRNHIAGNCYDYRDENGLLIHKYGPHIFHTSSKKVWDYLSHFTEWEKYFHKVLAVIDGETVPLPFNLNSMEKLFPKSYFKKIETKLLDQFGLGLKIPILKLMESDDILLKELADYVYKNVFLGYNLKQWGYKPEELDFSVSSRVPILVGRDDRYFQDTYQAMPKNGYTELMSKMINHPNINLLLNADYKDIIQYVKHDKVIYTGPIDEYFNYEFGELPYRSLNFEFKNYETNEFQEVAQVNYPNNNPYTRITEFKHFYPSIIKNTKVAYEFPQEYVKGENDPFYPIPKDENNLIYNRYKMEAEIHRNKVIFAGRLGEYKYYNMDQVIGIALQIFEKKILKLNNNGE